MRLTISGGNFPRTAFGHALDYVLPGRLWVGNISDSRIYHWRANSPGVPKLKLWKITRNQFRYMILQYTTLLGQWKQGICFPASAIASIHWDRKPCKHGIYQWEKSPEVLENVRKKSWPSELLTAAQDFDLENHECRSTIGTEVT